MKVTEIELKGRKFDVHVNENNGNFSAVLDGNDVRAESLAALKSELAKRITRSNAKISIPFLRWDNGHMRKGTITGIHASNRNMLIKWEGSKGVDQEWSYRGEKFIKPEAGDTYEVLARAVDSAKNALEEFVEVNSLDAREELKVALAKLGVDTND